MNDNQLIIVVVGIAALVGIGGFVYLGKKALGVSEMVMPILQLLVDKADAALVPYGDALEPLHGMIAAAGQAIDEDTDPLVKALKSPAIVAALREVLKQAQELTDGQPEG